MIIFPPEIDQSRAFYNDEIKIYFKNRQALTGANVRIFNYYTGAELGSFQGLLIATENGEDSYVSIDNIDYTDDKILVSIAGIKNSEVSVYSTPIVFRRTEQYNINHSLTVNNNFIKIEGSVNENDTDPLVAYNFILTVLEDGHILENSGKLYPQIINTFEYSSQTSLFLKPQLQWRLNLHFLSGVSKTIEGIINEQSLDIIPADDYFTVVKDSTAHGLNKITSTVSGDIYRLATDEKNYKCEYIAIITNGQSIYDYTIEAYKQYNYFLVADDICYVQKVLEHGYENILIADDKCQIAILYNPQITNFKEVVNESIVTPIGSKYPIVMRSGHTSYKQFNLSGLIATTFVEEEVAQDSQIKEGGVENNGFIPSYILTGNDSFERKEKLFRDRIIDFLHKDTIKLFRSPTEGVMLVKLTAISYTPNQQVGRNLYQVQMTVTEIADLTKEKLMKYGFDNSFTIDYQNEAILLKNN